MLCEPLEVLLLSVKTALFVPGLVVLLVLFATDVLVLLPDAELATRPFEPTFPLLFRLVATLLTPLLELLVPLATFVPVDLLFP